MKILIVDDCPISRRVLDRNLTAWGYDTRLAHNGREALESLNMVESPRLVVLDWNMPELDGIEVCQAIRREQSPYRYIIFLTGFREKIDAIEALRSGADDFLTKPVVPEELRQRIRAGQRIVNLQDRLLQNQYRLQEMATRDALTGVLNRGAMIEYLTAELERAGRKARPTSYLMLDLDHFKQVNDSYGHLTGDAVLCDVSRRLSASLRTYDRIGRFGGEEFGTILPETDLNTAQMVAERLRAAISQVPTLIDGREVHVTLSIGVACDAKSAGDTMELVGRADRALYVAKERGRNQVASEQERSPVIA